MSDDRAESIFRRPDLSINKITVPVPVAHVSFPEPQAVQLPTPVPTPVANANPVADALEQVAPSSAAAYVVARTYEGRIAPGKPWAARIQLHEASRVGIQVSADLDAEFTVSFTGTRGKQSGRPLFAPVSAPQSDHPSWFRVPAGVSQVNIGFRGNDAHNASVTIWLPSEVAGNPVNAATQRAA